jgi:hypothetical protein
VVPTWQISEIGEGEAEELSRLALYEFLFSLFLSLHEREARRGMALSAHILGREWDGSHISH